MLPQNICRAAGVAPRYLCALSVGGGRGWPCLVLGLRAAVGQRLAHAVGRGRRGLQLVVDARAARGRRRAHPVAGGRGRLGLVLAELALECGGASPVRTGRGWPGLVLVRLALGQLAALPVSGGRGRACLKLGACVAHPQRGASAVTDGRRRLPFILQSRSAGRDRLA